MTGIKLIQEKYNIKLTEDYINFLSVKNGFTVTEPNYIDFDIDFLDSSELALDKLYNLTELIEINDEFLSEIDIFLNCIIIGEDGGGNFYLIEDATGKTLYWDRTFLHQALTETSKVSIPSDLDESWYRKEPIYYIFDNFHKIALLINS